MTLFLVFLFFIPILVLVLLFLNLLLAPHKPYTEKVDVYECGFHPVGEQTRSNFNIQFFLLAMLFMVFDIELILFAPLGLALKDIDIFGFMVALIFFGFLTLGFVYECFIGALNFKNVLSLNTFKHGNNSITN